ncbi:hypothetical protein LMG26696_03292 [Achromobacter pulmonis]|nr:hypothetical protein LMG26696_03292 [Achromobacter pulmonis]
MRGTGNGAGYEGNPRSMSTLRRLILCTALLIAFILLGAQALGMLAAHRYLNTQLAQQAQAGASALAWALSHDPDGARDPRKLADDLFGAGMYARVRIAGENGDTRIERHDPATGGSDAAHDWRPAWLTLEAPPATRPYLGPDGRRLGTVTVQADARLARDTLWQGGVRVIGLTLAAGIFWALFAGNLLRWIEARTSKDIRDRIRALTPGGADSASRASGQEGLDQALVDAQRQAAATVQEQNARIESLQSEIQRDAITRLPNRKYFIDHFRQALASQETDAGGHILMFRQRDLAQINRHLSRAFTDQWLRSSSDRLRKLVESCGDTGTTLARMGGSDFALLMPRTSAPQAGMLAERVRRELRSLRVPMGKRDWCRWALAMAAYAPGDNMSDTLARLDHALMCAESADDDLISPASQAADSTRIGEYSWHDALSTALEQHRFSLSTQPLASVAGPLLHYEASLTLHDTSGADPVPAAIFMPPAVRLGLSAECDIQAIRLGLDWLFTRPEALAVHVSQASLAHGAFLSRLARMLADRPALIPRLIIEVDAAALMEHDSDMRQLCQIVTGAGGRIGLSRLSQQFGAMEHLHAYPLSYVKLCGSFISGILHSPGSQHLAATVMATATALGMAVYAEDVPDDATRAILEKIGVHAIRGTIVNFARAHVPRA